MSESRPNKGQFTLKVQLRVTAGRAVFKNSHFVVSLWKEKCPTASLIPLSGGPASCA